MKINIVSFLVLFIFILYFSYLHHSILNLDELQINTFSGEFLKNKIDFQYFTVFNLFLNLSLKILFISIVLVIGFTIYKIKIRIIDIFQSLIYSEFISIIIILYEIFYFKNLDNYSLKDVEYFYPMSILNVLNYKNIEQYYIYPLQTINFFEIIYVLMLSYLIHKVINVNYLKILKIVMASYGSALLLWVVVVMFFTLNYSQISPLTPKGGTIEC